MRRERLRESVVPTGAVLDKQAPGVGVGDGTTLEDLADAFEWRPAPTAGRRLVASRRDFRDALGPERSEELHDVPNHRGAVDAGVAPVVARVDGHRREDPVRLVVDPECGERPARTDVVQEVVPDRLVAFLGGRPVGVGGRPVVDCVGHEQLPQRVPQRPGEQGSLEDVAVEPLCPVGALDVGEGVVVGRLEPETLRQEGPVGRIRRPRQRRRCLDGEALLGRFLSAVTGLRAVMVVGRRSGRQQLQAVGVPLVSEQFPEFFGGRLGRRRRADAGDGQAVEVVGERTHAEVLGRDPQCHAASAGLGEVDHPLHAGVDGVERPVRRSGLAARAGVAVFDVAVGVRHRDRVGIRAEVQWLVDGVLRVDPLGALGARGVGPLQADQPAAREVPGAGLAGPGVRAVRDVGELEVVDGAVGGFRVRRLGRPGEHALGCLRVARVGGVDRFGPPDDVRRPLAARAFDQEFPGAFLDLVVARLDVVAVVDEPRPLAAAVGPERPFGDARDVVRHLVRHRRLRERRVRGRVRVVEPAGVHLRPEHLPPALLLGRQFGLVGVDVDVVRVHADSEFVALVALAPDVLETRLDAHRQHRDGVLAQGLEQSLRVGRLLPR